jgi:hypothetical protein
MCGGLNWLPEETIRKNTIDYLKNLDRCDLADLVGLLGSPIKTGTYTWFGRVTFSEDYYGEYDEDWQTERLSRHICAKKSKIISNVVR